MSEEKTESESDQDVDPPQKTNNKSKVKPKLHNLVLSKFSKEVTHLQNRFKSAVDSNEDLSPMDKFTHLQVLLEGRSI